MTAFVAGCEQQRESTLRMLRQLLKRAKATAACSRDAEERSAAAKCVAGIGRLLAELVPAIEQHHQQQHQHHQNRRRLRASR